MALHTTLGDKTITEDVILALDSELMAHVPDLSCSGINVLCGKKLRVKAGLDEPSTIILDVVDGVIAGKKVCPECQQLFIESR